LAFLYPNGVIYVPKAGILTAEYPLLEQVKALCCGREFCLVDRARHISNQEQSRNPCEDGEVDLILMDSYQVLFEWLMKLGSATDYDDPTE
jgi:hypothetical protein